MQKGLSKKKYLAEAKECVRRTLEAANRTLAPFGLTASEEEGYDFMGENRKLLGAYVDGSAFEHDVKVAVNYDVCLTEARLMAGYVATEDLLGCLREALEPTVWHEVVHGLWQGMDDLLRDCEEFRTAFWSGLSPEEKRELRDVTEAFREDEERHVESTALALFLHGTLEAAAKYRVRGIPLYPECRMFLRCRHALENS